MTKVCLVDDHVLMRNGLASVISSFPGYEILFQASNGRAFIEQLNQDNLPHLVLLDITMPEMNGYETAGWLMHHYPLIKVLALSMQQEERSIIRMLRNGAKGYLLKDAEQAELKNAIDAVMNRGIYVNEILYKNILQTLQGNNGIDDLEYQRLIELTEREKEFLRWLCTDKSYKEIAACMYLSPRTIDGYRDQLFDKLKVASRIGLVLFAIKNEIVKL